jgi:hypothetical protein
VSYAFPVAEVLSFMEFVQLLSDDTQLRSEFVVDPDATLSAYGLADLSPADVRDAIALVEDNRTVDWSDAYGSGGGAADDGIAFGTGSTAIVADRAGFDLATGPVHPDGEFRPGVEAGNGPGSTTEPVDPYDVSPAIDIEGVDPSVDDVLHDHTDIPFG